MDDGFQQTIIWTALPNGMAGNLLQLSVFVSPRLFANISAASSLISTTTLARFSDFVDWPARVAATHFNVQFSDDNGKDNGGITLSEAQAGQVRRAFQPTDELALDSNYWRALFDGKTTVKPYDPTEDDKGGTEVLAFPVANIAQFLRERYFAAATYSDFSAVIPPELSWHQESELKDIAFNADFRELLQDIANGVLDDAVKEQTPVDGPVIRVQPDLSDLLKPPKPPVPVLLGSDVVEAAESPAMRTRADWRNYLRLGQEPSLAQPTRDFARVFQSYAPAQQTAAQALLQAVLNKKDFHEAISAMGSYPELLRKLGLVIDLLIPIPAGMATTGTVRVWPDWADATRVNISPWTAYVRSGTAASFAPRPKGGNDQFVEDRMLHLNKQNTFYVGIGGVPTPVLRPAYSLTNYDVDGAALKMLDFAVNMTNVAKANSTSANAANKPAALPSLRTTGISIVQHGRDSTLQTALGTLKDRNKAAGVAGSQSSAPGAGPSAKSPDPQRHTLRAEDVLRGYRIDVYDTEAKIWFSLCRRDGSFSFNRKDAPALPPWSRKDSEGIVQLAVTQAPPPKDTSTSPPPKPQPLKLHEALFRWNGWSLCASRPGGRINDENQAELPGADPANPGKLLEQFPNDAQNEFGISASFRVTPGSLPRLRFGRSYRLRARAVDLAGNSLSLEQATAAQAETDAHVMPPAEAPLFYARYESVAPPVVVPTETFDITTPGESPGRMVIRSDWNQNAHTYPAALKEEYPAAVDKLVKQGTYDPKLMPADFPDTYLESTTERYLAAPKAAQSLVETHGMFDDPHGQGGWSPAAYELIKQREAGRLPVRFKQQQAGQRQPDLPYLPDPIARGVVLRGFAGVLPPGASFAVNASGEIDQAQASQITNDLKTLPKQIGAMVRVDFERENDAWYDLKLFRLRIADPGTARASDTPQAVTWDKAERILTVYVPKAEVVTVDLSSVFPEFEVEMRNGVRHIVWSLEHMGIWQQLADRLAGDEELRQRLAARNGCHWLMSPAQEITLVHAVQRPLRLPDLGMLKSPTWRAASSTSARIELKSFFPAAQPSMTIDGKSTVKVDIEASWQEPIDDTRVSKWQMIEKKAHVLEVPVHQNATSVQIVGTHHFGDTKHRMVAYTAVATSRFREYFPPGVDLTRSSEPVTINVPSSARPAPPKVRYVVPTFGWERSNDGKLTSTRHGGGLRIYLDRPWYSSGDGELLGVITFADATNWASEATRTKFGPYVSQWGTDPIWMSPAPSAMLTADHLKGSVVYREGGAPDPNVFLEELPDAGTPVKVTGYNVTYDQHPDETGHQRQLWYCDIQIDAGASYFPFVRLALVRYQPNSLKGVEISRVVLADFIQLVPGRVATITSLANPQQIHMTLAAVNHATYPSSPVIKAINPTAGRAHFEVTLEQRKPELGEDFGWEPVKPLNPFQSSPSGDVVWDTTMTLPGPRVPGKYRVVIKEYEVFFADDGPARDQTTTAKRLVYADVIPL